MKIIKEKSSLLSAAFFAAYAIAFIVLTISTFYYGDDLSTTAYVLLYVGSIGLPVTVFLKNKKAVLIASIITLVASFLFSLRRLIWIGFFRSFGDLSVALSYAALMIVVILSSKGNGIVKRIWFVPSIFGVLQCFGYLSSLALLPAIALFFAGLWLKDDLTPITSHKNATNSIKASSIGDAEKLKAFKDLLDSGAITQEEYDAKKKEILK